MEQYEKREKEREKKKKSTITDEKFTGPVPDQADTVILRITFLKLYSFLLLMTVDEFLATVWKDL